MKITPVAGAGAVQDLSTPEHVRTARAINAYKNAGQAVAPTQGNAQEHPVADANNISAEELSAIRPPTQDNRSSIEESPDQTAQEAAPEDSEAATPPPKKPEDTPLSRQYAQLARQERALRAKAQQQDQALKAREAALQAREAELTAKDQTYNKGYVQQDRLQKDTLQVLAESGVPYDKLYEQLTEQLLGTPVDPRVNAEMARLKAEIADLRSATDTSKKSYEQQQQSAYQQALKQIESDARALVKSDPTAYEAISKTGTVREVVKLIEETYKKDGVLMSVEDAAAEIENYLVEENYGMATRIEKIKRRITEAGQPKKSDVKTPTQGKQTQPQMKTLTNAAASSRKLSTKERAILAFKGELKN
jgi:hypothetical protein